jgi:dihydrodipicolinate synthase/N-acetylneuraminate lyase
VWATLLLPLNADDSIDFDRLAAQVIQRKPVRDDHLNRSGCQPRRSAADRRGGLIGLKTAGGDKVWFDEASKSGLAIFVPGHFLASMSLLGAHGSYSNVAALSPDGAVRTAHDLDVERRIAEFFAAHVAPLQKIGLSNPALDKFLAAVGDWADVGTRVRWPMQSATAEQVEAARPAARRLLPELF